MGVMEPDPSMTVTTADGVSVPIGFPKVSSSSSYSVLRYPEYIVYDTAQAVLRYLLRVKFHYN